MEAPPAVAPPRFNAGADRSARGGTPQIIAHGAYRNPADAGRAHRDRKAGAILRAQAIGFRAYRAVVGREGAAAARARSGDGIGLDLSITEDRRQSEPAYEIRERAPRRAGSRRRSGGDRAAQSDAFADRRGMIPKIVTGSGITGALAYVMGQGNDAQTGKRLELVPGETSRATIIGGQNFGFEIENAADLELARRIMEYQGLPQNQAGKTRKLDNDCYHASLSWGLGQKPSDEEMLQAGQEFLKAVGLEKARAVFVAHDDTDHKHIHVVASRIDPETGRSLRMDYDKKAAQKWALEWERAHGQQRTPEQGKNLHALIDGIEKRDAQAVLSHVTRDKPTFQAWELNRALGYGDLTDADKAAFRKDILSQKNVIGLSDTRDAAVSRYTTVEALAPEMALMSDAGKLKDQHHHAVRAANVDKAITDFTLKPEQVEALRHLTEANGLGILWGEAGTGKSHTLKAVRAVYEAEGYDVRGLSWTNDVVEQMRGDGFKNASTIAREFDALDKGRTSWTRNTVIIVDEAAMISTEALGKLASAASHAGAKLILAGDDAQLASIERGGTFETLRQKHGAAILSDVQRVKNVAEQKAWGEMHKGDFRPALEIADKAGNIHWSTRQSDTLKRMAERYTSDVQATPDKKRFMFALTNADVATLNAHARTLHKARGDLGADHALKTATGEQQFAEGDRIQFTGNGRTKEEKRAGLVNGRVGTIAGIEILDDGKPRVTVTLDQRSGEKPQQVSFTVGEDARAGEFDKFKHGYAGTIYRGQGRTLDEVYVGHSAQWRKSASYVALTRHREAVHIFAARETVKDLDAMAHGMARADNKRAASAYFIDEESAARAGLKEAVAEYSDRQAAPIAATIDNAKNVNASRTADPLMSSGAQPEATSARPLDESDELTNAVAGVATGIGRALDAVG